MKVLHAITGTENPGVNRGVVSLILELWSEGYFDDDYQPEMCETCGCGRYLTATFRLSADSHACRSTAESLEKIDTWMLKTMYKKILSNLKKIVPVSEGYIDPLQSFWRTDNFPQFGNDLVSRAKPTNSYPRLGKIYPSEKNFTDHGNTTSKGLFINR